MIILKLLSLLLLLLLLVQALGKLAVCLSQCYNDNLNNIKAGYAKFETFPVWNLPLKHPVNLAYEAATADLNDVNMIDNFHLDKYNISSVSYNRDLESFPLLKKLIHLITGKDVYYSPTDMGVNMVGNCIVNDEVICNSSKQEIIRRYYKGLVDYKLENINIDVLNKLKKLMDYFNLTDNDRKVIKYAHDKMSSSLSNAMAIELNDGKIIVGRQTDIMTSTASTILNALKYLSNIDDLILLISANIIKPMIELKKKLYNIGILDLNEVLFALSICSTTNDVARIALDNIKNLEYAEAHLTSIPSKSDSKVLKALKINFTSDPFFENNNLYRENS